MLQRYGGFVTAHFLQLRCIPHNLPIMPRAAKASDEAVSEQTLVIDNGGFTIKAGFASANPKPENCQVIPNCIARDRQKRVWIGNQLNNCKDFGEIVFRRPVEKGCLVNWEAEKAIWDHTFFDVGAQLKVNWSTSSMCLVTVSHMKLSVILMTRICCLAKHLILLWLCRPIAIRWFLKSSNLHHTGDF